MYRKCIAVRNDSRKLRYKNVEISIYYFRTIRELLHYAKKSVTYSLKSYWKLKFESFKLLCFYKRFTAHVYLLNDRV